MSHMTQQSDWRRRMLVLHGTMIGAPAILSAAARAGYVPTCLGVCLLQTSVGIPCPGCGITRSSVSLMTGDLHQAFQHHPSGPLIFIIALVSTAYFSAVLLRSVAVEWALELRLYSGFERLAVLLLIVGWLARAFIV